MAWFTTSTSVNTWVWLVLLASKPRLQVPNWAQNGDIPREHSNREKGGNGTKCFLMVDTYWVWEFRLNICIACSDSDWNNNVLFSKHLMSHLELATTVLSRTNAVSSKWLLSIFYRFARQVYHSKFVAVCLVGRTNDRTEISAYNSKNIPLCLCIFSYLPIIPESDQWLHLASLSASLLLSEDGSPFTSLILIAIRILY